MNYVLQFFVCISSVNTIMYYMSYNYNHFQTIDGVKLQHSYSEFRFSFSGLYLVRFFFFPVGSLSLSIMIQSV